MAKTILDQLIEIKDAVPKKQRALCNYIVLNYEQLGIMTVAELAEKAQVGTTTVIRLMQSLGYESFNAFKRDIMDVALMRNTSSYRSLKQSFVGTAQNESSDTFRGVAADGIRVLENLCSPANVEQFEAAVKLLLSAEQIYTLGMRSSKAMALYFEYVVDCFYPHVRQLSTESDYIYDRAALYIRPVDVLLAFSVWPCTKKTIEVAELCHKRGVPVVLVTNTSLNPMAKFADVVIDTNSVNHASGDVAIMAVVESLASEMGRRTAPKSTENIEGIEKMLAENDIIMWEY